MMRKHWPELFRDYPILEAQAQAVAERVYEFGAFLLHVLEWKLPAGAPVVSEDVVLHTSCSARREMGTRAHGVALVDAVPGVTRVEHERESECCGFGGSFAVKHADISGAMVTDKVAAMRATGCCRVVSADCACLLNIGHAAQHQGAPLAVEHLASFLWRRIGDLGEQA
jgi:L-lactate dehydrogenase complex protein LldE